MDRQQFISYINEPGNLDKNSLGDIEELTAKFPYCQSLQILHVLNLKMVNHVMYSEQLKSTAAHIADRKRLRELIRSMQSEENRKSSIHDPLSAKAAGEKGTPNSEPRTPNSEPIVPIIEQDEEVRLLALKQIVENRLKEITGDKETKKGETPVTIETTDESKISPDELINKFIREKPSISRLKTDFFDPVKVAKSSQKEQPGLVTETLARIHIQQGNIDKAIEIYRKLSLNFPEKSSYFAAQIKKLSTEN